MKCPGSVNGPADKVEAGSMKIKKAGIPTKIIVMVLLVYMAISLLNLREQIQAAEAQKETLSAQVEKLSQKNDKLAADIARSGDPALLEEIAREKLGLVLPGEKIFIDVSN